MRRQLHLVQICRIAFPCLFMVLVSDHSFAATYYSRATGNWTAPATWSTDAVLQCAGAAAATVPAAGDNVVICAGTTVTFDAAANVTIADLTIQATGTLTYTANKNLTINSLVLNGAIDGAGGPKDIEVGNTAGSTMSGTGSFNTSATVDMKLLNDVTILSGSNLVFNGSGQLNLNNTTLTNEGKIQILNPSAMKSTGAATFVNNGPTAHLVYTTQADFPGITVILTSTSSGNTVEFGATAGGPWKMDNIGSYYHLIISGAAIKQCNAAPVTIAGNLTINSGATLDANGKDINIGGDWDNDNGGAFTEGIRKVTFNGSLNNQNIYPPAAGETFYDLTINNTFTNGTITANDDIIITTGRTLLMTSGTFILGANSLNQTGAANLTATGGDLRLGTLAGTLPELTGTYNITGGTITFNGAGAQTIRSLNATPSSYYNVVIGGSGAKTLAGNVTVQANWTNNGATLTGGANTVTFTGTSNTISGTSVTDFPAVILTTGAGYTMDNSNTATSLTFNSSATASSLTHGGTNPSLTVSGAVTINQPSASVTTSWYINGGSATVGGTLSFVGANTTASRVGQVVVTSGTLTANGAVNFAANNTDAVQVITVTGTGNATFASSVVTTAGADLRDGTLSVTSAGSMTFSTLFDMRGGTVFVSATGTLTFNGSPAFAYTNTSVPTLTTNFGSTIYFNGNLTVNSAAAPPLTFAAGSYSIFKGNSTITPTAAVTFGYYQINAGVTVTLAGNISVANDWTNLGGTLTGNFTVTFSGAGTQTITKAGGETFYGLTSNATGPIFLANDVEVTNALTLTTGDYDLNGKTLTLGNAAASSLSRAAGILYGGIFRRWWLTGTPVTSTSGNYYGLFPVGSSLSYRPVAVNSTADPTTAGYVSVRHYDAITVTNLSYTDNEADAIERKHDQYHAMSIGTLAGGTYSITASFASLSSVGALGDMKLITYTGAAAGSVGASDAATGSVSSPNAIRTGLGPADLQNDWVVSTKNKAATPLRPPYYSRKTGNWNDGTVGDATWSLTSGGAGPSCDCTPSTDALVYISSGQTVSLTAAATCDYIIVEDAATLDGTANLTTNIDILTNVSGRLAPTSGTWAITRNLTLGSSSASSTPSAAMTVTGDLTVPAGATLTMNQNLTVGGDLTTGGIIAVGANTLTLNGSAKDISGTGSITGSGSISITGNKTVISGTSLTVSPVIAIANGATTVTSNGTINLQNNLTGTGASSTWTNAAGSVLNITGDLLTTAGTVLNASAAANTVNYNGGGAQTVKVPSANTYYNLTSANAGTKTAGGALTISNMLTIQDAATFYDNTSAITGVAGVTMSGTAVYQIRSSSTPVPSLSGTYNLTGGTMSFDRAGAQTVRSTGLSGAAPQAYYHATFGNSNVKTLEGAITVQGNLTIAGTAQLDVSGSNYGIGLAGNWAVTSTNGDPFLQQSGTVTLSGTSQQTISTVLAGGETFYKLFVSNTTAASAVSLSSNVTVSNNLKLTDGHVLTTPVAAGLLTMSSGASITLNCTPQDSSFIKGKLACIIAGNSSTTKIFPIGKDNDYRRVDLTIDHSPNATVTYTSEMKNSSARTLGYAVPGTLTDVSDMRYYEITSSSPATGLDNAVVYLNYQCTQRSDVVQDLPNLRAAQWDGASDWIDIGGTAGGSVCGGSDYAGNVLSDNNAITSFTGNKFVLANGSGGVNPLPVEFLTFEARPSGNIVDVAWETASEQNSSYFMVQRSKDGLVFQDVDRVKASGNSSTIKHYSASDYEPYSGISYYRLKQVDLDGQHTFSNVIAVNFNGAGTIGVYPNPASGPFYVTFSGIQEGKSVLVVLKDLLGREFYSTVMIAESNGKDIIGIDPSGRLPAGVYIVVATSDNNVYEKKIVIR